MASSQAGAASGAQPQAGPQAAPEHVWMPFIRDLYHNLLGQTYFLPPNHYNRTPRSVQTLAGQTALVRENPPPPRRRRRQPPAPSGVRVVGTVFAENQPQSQNVHVMESDQQDDLAQRRCLGSLSHIPNQVMMVVSSLEFQKYLNNHTNPLYAAAISQLPSFQHPAIPPYIADGECDILILHRQYGLLIGEIKSVGGGSYFQQQSPDGQTQILISKVEGALKQLQNQEIGLRHLVSDLPHIRITKTLLLPNIRAHQLRQALQASPSLLQTLCQTLSLKTDINLAVRTCQCRQNRKRPSTWWKTLNRKGPDPFMTDDLYIQLVARFCGPATTVTIPTAGIPRKVVRSLGDAVAETGLRFSSLTLTPSQVLLLNAQPEPQYLYLQGPPGTGKTVVLLLKALQWARQGRQVVLLWGNGKSLAVVTLIAAQLRNMLDVATAAKVQVHNCHLGDSAFDAGVAVSRLQQHIGSAGGAGPVLVVLDEADLQDRENYIHWLTEVRTQLPAVTVWTAGVWKFDRPLPVLLPPWLEVQTLQEALRSPPSVTSVLEDTYNIRAELIPPYTQPQLPVATQGPKVQRQRHYNSALHDDQPWNCHACGDQVAYVLCELRVGQPGQPLEYRDVWILYGDYDDPKPDSPMVQLLQDNHVPVQVVTSWEHLTEAEAQELALGVTDQIMVVNWQAVQGLERRVLIVLGTYGIDDLLSRSRSSSSLYLLY